MIPIEDPILQLKHVSISYTPGKNAVNDVNADIKRSGLRLSWALPDAVRAPFSGPSTGCTNYTRISGYREKF